MNDTKKPARARARDGAEGFTDEERAAMKERAKEVGAPARRGKGTAKPDGESDLLAKIAEMPDADRVMAERVHAVITAAVPGLEPRTWYGMPAYYKDGSVLCFFQAAAKFKARYAMLGFSDKAQLDDGALWPCYYALKEVTAAAETRIADLVRQAAS
jgi:uncharacterized protein YdhG (YjbR/CyaY superfamily)